ncbi:MAG: methyltransferase domain-containing protein [Thermoplasmata archaeon]|nr:methyltransferase domain-containing protein [Thermoplasmata archaeon]
MAIDQEKLNALVGKFVNDLGASLHGSAILVGEQLGLYKALASGGPVTSEELAKKTGMSERYLREWLAGQAASGFVDYDPRTKRYLMTPEQKFTLTDEDSPVYIPGAYYIVASVYKDQRKITEAIRAGKGFGWHEHHNDLFMGTRKFFRPGYLANLVSSWLPSLEGVVHKLEAGARVADVGCGLGASTIIMAKAFPKSKFIGYDYHLESIEWANNAAVTEGVTQNTDFQVSTAKEFPGKSYDLVTFFDCLHDMGDPVGAARHVRQSLKPDGTWMIVEPFANQSVEQNLNPVGRIFYNASLQLCVPSSLAQEVGAALGAQATDASLNEVFRAGGFTRMRKPVETPFNRVFEVRP